MNCARGSVGSSNWQERNPPREEGEDCPAPDPLPSPRSRFPSPRSCWCDWDWNCGGGDGGGVGGGGGDGDGDDGDGGAAGAGVARNGTKPEPGAETVTRLPRNLKKTRVPRAPRSPSLPRVSCSVCTSSWWPGVPPLSPRPWLGGGSPQPQTHPRGWLQREVTCRLESRQSGQGGEGLE